MFRAIQQLLRSRHEQGAVVGFVPSQLYETPRSKPADETTKKQIAVLANMPDTELWECLQKTLTEGSTAINMAIFSLDKVGTEQEASY